jgi:hypothetical protein
MWNLIKTIWKVRKVLTLICSPDTGPVDHDRENHQSPLVMLLPGRVGDMGNLQLYLDINVKGG